MTARIAILGWGSLLWDGRPEFDRHRGPWRRAGPTLPVEFARVSVSRANALTLVIDTDHGVDAAVAYSLSTRARWEEAAEDLAARENATTANIGVVTAAGSARGKHHDVVTSWLSNHAFDAAIWTGLGNNFAEDGRPPFSIPAALEHLRELDGAGRSQASQYFARAPAFVQTPLRAAVADEPWYRHARAAAGGES